MSSNLVPRGIQHKFLNHIFSQPSAIAVGPQPPEVSAYPLTREYTFISAYSQPRLLGWLSEHVASHQAFGWARSIDLFRHHQCCPVCTRYIRQRGCGLAVRPTKGDRGAEGCRPTTASPAPCRTELPSPQSFCQSEEGFLPRPRSHRPRPFPKPRRPNCRLGPYMRAHPTYHDNVVRLSCNGGEVDRGRRRSRRPVEFGKSGSADALCAWAILRGNPNLLLAVPCSRAVWVVRGDELLLKNACI